MARVRLNFTTLMAAVQTLVETRTGKKCYDSVPLNAEAPFYSIEPLGVDAANTKVMYRDIFHFQLHVIAPAPGPDQANSSVPVFDLMKALEEACTENITLPEPYKLIDQRLTGPVSFQTDPTNEKHAIYQIDLMVAYGFICK